MGDDNFGERFFVEPEGGYGELAYLGGGFGGFETSFWGSNVLPPNYTEKGSIFLEIRKKFTFENFKHHANI